MEPTRNQWMDLYDEQVAYIEKHFGKGAADEANYGWGSDDTGAATKVYGYGVLDSQFENDGTITHSFRTFGSA